jgi:hypothetical protein
MQIATELIPCSILRYWVRGSTLDGEKGTRTVRPGTAMDHGPSRQREGALGTSDSIGLINLEA